MTAVITPSARSRITKFRKRPYEQHSTQCARHAKRAGTNLRFRRPRFKPGRWLQGHLTVRQKMYCLAQEIPPRIFYAQQQPRERWSGPIQLAGSYAHPPVINRLHPTSGPLDFSRGCCCPLFLSLGNRSEKSAGPSLSYGTMACVSLLIPLALPADNSRSRGVGFCRG
ncbi:hypothetical protein V22_04710 [Calycomorphotria hydatis]|uniref:Uncharacterized protein n=1 Tax=Calycomorphotria hydatis TaxID=2528027 RepID=A0A517T4E9_9PLAN|nr:hypothetical protein V22_04710 [Calycomorphotria hydatis]